MDGPRHYHTKRNKSDRERQILYDLMYKWNLKRNRKLINTENRWVDARDGD